MKGFLTAMRFLTAIPLGAKRFDAQDMPRAIAYFPIVGLVIGLIAALASKALTVLNIGEFAANSILVVLLMVITGALHLDGLADTFDAISSGKPKDEMLNIMRDPHVGTMGVLSLIAVILLKFSLLFCVGVQAKGASLVLMCVLSRWSLVMAMSAFPYARKEGKAAILIAGTGLKALIPATVTVLIIAASVFQVKGIVIFAIVAVAAYMFGKAITRKIGGMTGDTLGATSEFIEIVTLFGICALKGVLL